MTRAIITGWGSYLPAKILTNDQLPAALETSDAWIRERTGIQQRHIVAEGEYTSDLATHAGRAAIERAGMSPAEIDLVLLATATPDETFPGTSCRVQHRLGCNAAAAMDIQAACSGFVYGLSVANGMILSGQAKNVLLIGAETMSRVVDWNDRRVCILFGDGAGAVVVQASDQDSDKGILATHLAADGQYAPMLATNGGVSTTQTAGFLHMEGKEVFRHAVQNMVESSEEVLRRAGINADAVAHVIPHQANARILLACMKKLGIDESRLVMTVSVHANTSSASIPLALAAAADEKKLKSGDLILFTALGAGFTWGSCLIRW